MAKNENIVKKRVDAITVKEHIDAITVKERIDAITVKERIDAIAKKHGVKKVFELAIPMDDDGKDIAVGYIKKPNRTTLGAAMGIMNTNPMKANEIILKSSWLEGDERILDDDDAFMSASTLLEKVITIRQGEIKKN